MHRITAVRTPTAYVVRAPVRRTGATTTQGPVAHAAEEGPIPLALSCATPRAVVLTTRHQEKQVTSTTPSPSLGAQGTLHTHRRHEPTMGLASQTRLAKPRPSRAANVEVVIRSRLATPHPL